MDRTYDVVLLGGGLANGLIAATILERLPGMRLVLVEQDHALGGNHTWSFLTTDISAQQQRRLLSWADYSWPAYSVRFPSYERTLHAGYHTLQSASFDARLRGCFAAASHAELRLGQKVRQIERGRVTLQSGEVIASQCILDGRGPRLERNDDAPVGFQKFLGLEVELEHPWGDAAPILMDATVAQVDGFRFIYVLPLTPNRVLIEDTYYSHSSALDAPVLRQRVRDHITSKGGIVKRVVREESGVLPLPRRVQARGVSRESIAVGYRGGWFHPTTGYSVPQACRVADYIASALSERENELDLTPLSREFHGAKRFACALNTLLFDAFAVHDQRNVLERFYRLPEPVIARFYALESSLADRARIVCGRVPKGFSPARLLAGGHPL